MNYVLKILIGVFCFLSGILFSIIKIDPSYNLMFSLSSFFLGILFTSLVFFLYREYQIRTLKLNYSYYTKLIIKYWLPKMPVHQFSHLLKTIVTIASHYGIYRESIYKQISDVVNTSGPLKDLYSNVDDIFPSDKEDKSKLAQETLKSENKFSISENDHLESLPEEKFE